MYRVPQILRLKIMITMNKTSTENQHIFLASRKDLGMGGWGLESVGNYWTIPYEIHIFIQELFITAC